MKKYDPGDDDGQAPLRALQFGTDVMDRTRVVRINVELNVFEIRGVVEQVEYQTR